VVRVGRGRRAVAAAPAGGTQDRNWHDLWAATETENLGRVVGHQRLHWSKVVARSGVEPPTFRFSGLGITVRRTPLTSVTCIAALTRTLVNADEYMRMRPKMRPPGLSCLAVTFAHGRVGMQPVPGSAGHVRTLRLTSAALTHSYPRAQHGHV
jgi:hypothetical protein